jgi:hypothetical protein
MNQQDQLNANNQSTQTEELADLPLAGEQAEDTKAGTGAHVGGGIGAGKVSVHDLI